MVRRALDAMAGTFRGVSKALRDAFRINPEIPRTLDELIARIDEEDRKRSK